MQSRPEAGVWEAFVPGVHASSRYHYHVISRFGDYSGAKADPYAQNGLFERVIIKRTRQVYPQK